MRFPSSIIAFVLGLLALGIGIGQLTVWAPDETQTARSDAAEEAPLTIITDGVIDSEEEREELTIEAEGEYTVALARIDDIEAWVDDAAHNRITGVEDGADGPEIASEHVEGDSEIPDPSGSDLWAAAETAEGPLSYSWVAPDESGDWALLLFVDGEEPAPATVSTEVTEEPNHTVGIVLIVVGVLLILLSLGLFYRALASRRKERDLIAAAYDPNNGGDPKAEQPKSGQAVGPAAEGEAQSPTESSVQGAQESPAPPAPPAEEEPTAVHGAVASGEDEDTTLIGTVPGSEEEATTALPAIKDEVQDEGSEEKAEIQEEEVGLDAKSGLDEKVDPDDTSGQDSGKDEGAPEGDGTDPAPDEDDSGEQSSGGSDSGRHASPHRWWRNGSVATAAAVAVALSPAAGLSGSVIAPFGNEGEAGDAPTEQDEPEDAQEGSPEPDAEGEPEEDPEDPEETGDDESGADETGADESGADESGADEAQEGSEAEEEPAEEDESPEQPVEDEPEEQPEQPEPGEPESGQAEDDRDREIDVEGEMPSEGYSVLLEAQLERILGEISETVEEGDSTLDAEVLTDRVAGNALETREMAYRNHEAADSSLPAPIGTEVLAAAVTSDAEFPRQAVVITQHEDAEVPTILVIEQEEARANYRLVETAPMVPGTEFPSISAEQGGIEPVPADGEGARMTPREGVEGMAGYFSDPGHDFGEAVGDSIFVEDLHEYYSSLEESAADTEISFSDPDVHEDVYALQLPDGSVVAAGSFDMNLQMSPNEAGDTIFLEDLVAELAETSWTTFPTSITHRETVVVHIPADESEEIVLIGVEDLVADASVEEPDWFDGY